MASKVLSDLSNSSSTQTTGATSALLALPDFGGLAKKLPDGTCYVFMPRARVMGTIIKSPAGQAGPFAVTREFRHTIWPSGALPNIVKASDGTVRYWAQTRPVANAKGEPNATQGYLVHVNHVPYWLSSQSGPVANKATSEAAPTE